MNFKFQTTPYTQRYCEEVIRCIVELLGQTEEKAIILVDSLLDDCECLDEEDPEWQPFLEAPPYYTAMGIAYHPEFGWLQTADGKPWWKDPSLWPPPKEWLFLPKDK